MHPTPPIVSDCHNDLLFRDNLFAISMLKLAASLLFVKTRRTGAEYWGFDTSLLRKISVSGTSNVLLQLYQTRGHSTHTCTNDIQEKLRTHLKEWKGSYSLDSYLTRNKWIESAGDQKREIVSVVHGESKLPWLSNMNKLIPITNTRDLLCVKFLYGVNFAFVMCRIKRRERKWWDQGERK